MAEVEALQRELGGWTILTPSERARGMVVESARIVRRTRHSRGTGETIVIVATITMHDVTSARGMLVRAFRAPNGEPRVITVSIWQDEVHDLAHAFAELARDLEWHAAQRQRQPQEDRRWRG